MATVSLPVSDTTPEQQGPPNRAPMVSSAIADAIVVNESGTRQVSLSGVFDDADGDSLTVAAAASDEGIATVSVASDQSSLTVTAKAWGTATITVEDAFTVGVLAKGRLLLRCRLERNAVSAFHGYPSSDSCRAVSITVSSPSPATASKRRWLLWILAPYNLAENTVIISSTS